MPRQNFKDAEKQGLQAGELSLDALQQLSALFGGQQGGISTLLNQSLQQLLGLSGSSTNQKQTKTGKLTDRANLKSSKQLLDQFNDFNLGRNQLTQDIMRGSTASPQDLAAIQTAGNSALEAGMVDINRFRDEGLEALRTQLAPARGLRSDDTPILDRGAEIVGESNRAGAQLSSQIRSQMAEQQLLFPLQRRASDMTGLGLQGQFLQGQQQFLSGLQQRALANRLNIANAFGGQASSLFGLGASLAGRQIGTSPMPKSGDASVMDQIGQGIGIAGGLSGGLGGLASGIGGIMAAQQQQPAPTYGYYG